MRDQKCDENLLKQDANIRSQDQLHYLSLEDLQSKSAHKNQLTQNQTTYNNNNNNNLKMTLIPGHAAPKLELPTLSGGNINLAEAAKEADFLLVVFYRGTFCPICRTYLKEIEESYPQLTEANIKVVTISMSTKEEAEEFEKMVISTLDADDIKTPIAYGLTQEQAKEWGLHFSKLGDGNIFTEPGIFSLKPDNTVYTMAIQTAPMGRPSIAQLIGGLSYLKANNVPPLGAVQA